MAIDYKCPECGSTHLTLTEVPVYWSVDNQQWQQSMDYEDIYCNDCGDLICDVGICDLEFETDHKPQPYGNAKAAIDLYALQINLWDSGQCPHCLTASAYEVSNDNHGTEFACTECRADQYVRHEERKAAREAIRPPVMSAQCSDCGATASPDQCGQICGTCHRGMIEAN